MDINKLLAYLEDGLSDLQFGDFFEKHGEEIAFAAVEIVKDTVNDHLKAKHWKKCCHTVWEQDLIDLNDFYSHGDPDEGTKYDRYCPACATLMSI
jgi:hypothetical protein